MESFELWITEDFSNLKGSITVTGTEELNYVYTTGITNVAPVGIFCSYCSKFIDLDNNKEVE